MPLMQRAPIAVIGSTPDCTELVVIQHRITFHAKLMGAKDVVHAVETEKFLDNGCAERISRATDCQWNDAK